jgi:RNA polymerase sigma factor FliA
MQRDSRVEAQPAAEAGLLAPPLDIAPGYRLPASEADETEAIRLYMPAVKRLAGHMKGRLPEGVQLDDLIQAGLIAILRIVRQGGGVAQLGAAALRRTITNAMIDEARREAWAPVRTVRLAKAAANAMRVVKRRTGRDGSDEEVAAELAIPVADYHRALLEIAGIRLLQLDAFDEGGELGLQIAGGQETGLQRRRMMAALVVSIAALPERERLVVSLYYEHELNMEEVGRVLGLNKSTVCRAHGRALLMLRSALDGWREDRTEPQPAAGG